MGKEAKAEPEPEPEKARPAEFQTDKEWFCSWVQTVGSDWMDMIGSTAKLAQEGRPKVWDDTYKTFDTSAKTFDKEMKAVTGAPRPSTEDAPTGSKALTGAPQAAAAAIQPTTPTTASGAGTLAAPAALLLIGIAFSGCV